MAKFKFKFHFKNGKTFECIEELESEMAVSMVSTCKSSFRDNIDAVLCFEDCCVRLSDCSVVEWEVLE